MFIKIGAKNDEFEETIEELEKFAGPVTNIALPLRPPDIAALEADVLTLTNRAKS